MVEVFFSKTQWRNNDVRVTFFKVKFILVFLCQVAVSHFVFVDGRVVAALLQCCVLVGHLQVRSRDEEGLLFFEIRSSGAAVIGDSSSNDGVPVVHRLQVVLHRSGSRQL